MADNIEAIHDRMMETLGEIEDELGEVELSDSDKKRVLDIVAPDYSDSDQDAVEPVNAATHNDPTLFVTEENYEKYENGEVSRDELGAFEEDDITTHERFTGVIPLLFAPRSRAVLIDSWIREGERPITVTELAECSDSLTRQTIHFHVDVLLDIGFIVESGKKGNAMSYQLNIRNPLVQTCHMLANLGRFGRTRLLLERDFLVPGPNGESIDHDEKGYSKE